MFIRHFFNHNPALATAIILPSLLVVLFAFSALIPKIAVDAPQYNLLFSVKHYDPKGEYEYRIHIVNHKAKVQGRRLSSKHGIAYNYQLYLYNAKTKQVKEIKIPFKRLNSSRWTTIAVKDLKNLPVSSELVSPDGYALHNDYRRTSDLGLLFFSGSQKSAIQIEKNSRIISIHPPKQNNHIYTPEFVGWVTPKPKEKSDQS